MVAAEAVDVVVVAAAAAVAAEAAVAAVAVAAAGAAVVSEAAAYRGASAVFADPRRALLGIDKRRFFGRARESHPELLSTPVGKDIGATAGLAKRWSSVVGNNAPDCCNMARWRNSLTRGTSAHRGGLECPAHLNQIVFIRSVEPVKHLR